MVSAQKAPGHREKSRIVQNIATVSLPDIIVLDRTFVADGALPAGLRLRFLDLGTGHRSSSGPKRQTQSEDDKRRHSRLAPTTSTQKEQVKAELEVCGWISSLSQRVTSHGDTGPSCTSPYTRSRQLASTQRTRNACSGLTSSQRCLRARLPLWDRSSQNDMVETQSQWLADGEPQHSDPGHGSLAAS